MSEEKEKLQLKMQGVSQEDLSDSISVSSRRTRSRVVRTPIEFDEIDMCMHRLENHRLE